MQHSSSNMNKRWLAFNPEDEENSSIYKRARDCTPPPSRPNRKPLTPTQPTVASEQPTELCQPEPMDTAPPVLPAAPPAAPPGAPPGAPPLAMPFPSPAAGVHHGTDFVSGLEHFPQLGRGLSYVEVTPLCVAWDVQVGADGSRIETDQRAEFVRARLGMGVMTPQVGRAGERGGVYRIDMQPTNATTPNPNVVKMQRYAASHPSSAEAKIQELERRWDADPLLRRSHDRASAHDRLDAPKGGPNSKHCDELLKQAETNGRSREVSKEAAWASGDADGSLHVTARTKLQWQVSPSVAPTQATASPWGLSSTARPVTLLMTLCPSVEGL